MAGVARSVTAEDSNSVTSAPPSVTLEDAKQASNAALSLLGETSLDSQKRRTPLTSGDLSKAHTKQKRVVFECDICEEVFYSEFSLTLHVRSKHLQLPATDGRPTTSNPEGLLEPFTKRGYVKDGFPCDKCDAVFNFKSTLKRHKLRQHSGVVTFSCEECGAVYSKHNSLIRHWEEKHKEKSEAEKRRSPCDHCEAAFENPLLLKWHKLREHYNGEVFSCDECPAAYPKCNSLREHQLKKHFKLESDSVNIHSGSAHKKENHSEKQYVRKAKHTEAQCTKDNCFHCDQCTAKFKNRRFLRWHKVQEHYDGIKFPCTFCKAIYTTSNLLNLHMTSMHGDKKKDKDNEKVENREKHESKKKLENKKRKFPCKECDLTFDDRTSLGWHMVDKHREGDKFSCEFCEAVFARKHSLHAHVSLKHRDRVAVQEIYCKACYKTFPNRLALFQHRKNDHTVEDETGVHYPCVKCGKRYNKATERDRHWLVCSGGEKPFACPLCPKRFSAKGDCTLHTLTHTGEKKHFCEICNKGFIRKEQLTTHMRSHTGERPYSCEICSKTFANRTTLYTHKLSHEEGKFACDFCGKKFTNRAHLENHRRTHTGEKPFQCQECGKAFSQRQSLKNHMVSHSSVKAFDCNICQKSFAYATSLRNHMRTHTGERPYVCKECGKGFTTCTDLKSHSMSHTGVKPYTCSICGRGFARPGLFNQHMQTHHGELPPHQHTGAGEGLYL